MKFKGAVFDMDGLLLDTEKLYTRFWCEAGQQCGYLFELKHALSLRSLSKELAIQKLKGYFGRDFDYQAVHDLRVVLMDKFIKENGVEAKEGASELLNYLRQNNYKIALATSSPLERASEHLSLVGLYDFFDAFACRPMVKFGKPAPDIYLLACDRLSLAPQQCVALEDSPTGVRSAFSAGCSVINIPDMDMPDAETQKMLFACCKDLGQVIDLLRSI